MGHVNAVEFPSKARYRAIDYIDRLGCNLLEKDVRGQRTGGVGSCQNKPSLIHH